LARALRDQQQETATNTPNLPQVTPFSGRNAGYRINYSLTKLADC